MGKKFNNLDYKHYFLFAFALLPQFLVAQTCPGLGSITLNVVAPPAPTLNFASQLCAGSSTTISVNQSFSDYNWSIGGNGQSITVNGPGNYTVTVTNSGGCTATAVANIQANTAPAPNVTANPYACNGTFVLNAGSGFSTYAWSNGGGSAATASFNSSGTYTVTVTNSFGCTGTDDFNVTIPTPPAASITGTGTFCSGTGTALTATAGFSNYTWTGGGNGATLNVNTGGTYTVTVTDAFGCTATSSALVQELPFTPPTISGAGVLCTGATQTLSVPGSYANYNWSTAQSGPSISIANSGTFTVTVTAANGCTGTATTTVTAGGNTNTSISGNLNLCTGATSTLTATGSFSNYSWSNSASGPNISINLAGTYTVTVTNSAGCTGTASVTAVAVAPPAVSISGNGQICPGGNLTLSATPGLSSYSWSGGGAGNSLTVSNPGNYTVTVTNSAGCSATATTAITAFPQPVPNVVGTSGICQGGNTVFSVSAPFTQYNWSNNQSTPTITVTTAGTYTVTVTDANGCTGTDTQVLTVTPNPSPVISESPYACNEQLTLNAGNGFVAYAWSIGGNSTPSVTVTNSGNYSVTVTNAQGCTGVDTYLADIPILPSVGITAVSQLCAGSSTVLAASPGLVSYVWSNAQVGANLTIGTGGTYTVTATDQNGCTATSSVNVGVSPVPTPAIAGPSSICSGSSATFSVPGNFLDYDWSTGASSPTINVNAGGIYTVTVTAQNGCTGTDTQVLSVTTSLSPQITETPYNCNGQITLDAGLGFNTYNWSNGTNTQTITVNVAEDYTVTVSDAVGCTGIAIYTVDIPAPPTVGISGNLNFCQGSNTVLTASAGLNAYVWSTGQIGPNLTVTQSNNYTVTATDPYGCEATATVNVTSTPAPNATINGPTVICVNSTGTLTAAGGTAYQWSNTATTPNISITNGGPYTVTVSNSAGCTATASLNVSVANSLSPNIVVQPYQCNGSLDLNAGTGFTTYIWSGGQNTPTISAGQSGVYTVTVTDNTGCSGTSEVTVNLPALPVATIAGNTTFCASSSAVLTANAGFVNYLWSNSTNGSTLTTNAPGTYTVTVTDAQGCTATASVTANSVPNPVATISGPASVCAGNSASLSVGATFANYNWSNGNTTNAINVNTTDTYTVTVTDNNGCSATSQLAFQVFNNPVPAISEAPYACTGTLTLSTGAGFSVYNWSNGGNAASITTTNSGPYSVTVTDQNGCSGTATTTINVPVLPNVNITGPTGFCPGNTADLIATTGFSAYNWSTGGQTNTINVGNANLFTVTVTDAQGCTATAAFATTVYPAPVAAISGPTNVCPNNTATLSANGIFAAYNWDNGAQTPSITVVPPATAALTVTDQNGCTATATTAVGVSNQISPQISQLPYDCSGQVTLDAGSGFPTYNWSAGGGNATLTVNTSGTYTVTVSDGGGCSGTATVQVNVPTLPTVSISGGNAFCPGASTTLVANSGFASYAWTGGNNTETLTINAAGTYTVTVTDAQGCTATAAFAATVYPAPAVAINGPTNVCPNNTATLLANGIFTAYNWDNGAQTPSITVVPPATATLTVTDQNGCTATATTAVGVSNQISPQISQLPYDCSGQVTLDAGSGFPTYNWSAGGGNATLTVNTSGTYTVTVSDGGGCSGTATVQVNVPNLPAVSISGGNAFCPGASTTLVANSGFTSYAWTGGNNTEALTVNAAGTYTVTVTDTQGCTATATALAQVLAPPSVQIDGLGTICGTNPTALSVSGVFANVIWSTGQNGNSIQVATPGTYTVTVTDAQGCTNLAQTQLVPGSNLQPVITQLPYLCDGVNTFFVLTGVTTHTYLWSNGNTLSAITVNQSGPYTVTVTDGQGCTGTASVQASIPPPPVVQLSGDNTFCIGQNGLITANTGFANYSWSNNGTTNSITVNQSGTYTVTVTDAQGCTATSAFTATAQPLPTPTITVQPADCAGTMSLDAGSTYTAYTWSNSGNTASVSVTQAGTYTVTVTNASGCTGTALAAVSIVQSDTVFQTLTSCNPANVGTQTTVFNAANGCDSVVVTTTTLNTTVLNGVITSGNDFNGYDVSCATATDGLAVVTIFGAAAPIQYQWSGGNANGPVIQNVPAGNYAVTFTDVEGCSGTATIELSAPPPIVPAVEVATASCFEAGSVTLGSISGGVGPYEVRLGTLQLPGTSGTDATVIEPNTFGALPLQITDANGCVFSDTYDFPAPQDFLQQVSDTLEITAGQSVVLDAQAITIVPNSISWSPAINLSCTDCLAPTASPTATIRYELAVEGTTGCKGSGLFLVIVRQADRKVYAPNTFDPNDPDNSGFTIFGDNNLLKIKSLQVYDRWGGQMAVFQNMAPNDPATGWNGTYRNRLAEPGVYTYWAELEYADGSTEIIKGDVTLIR